MAIHASPLSPPESRDPCPVTSIASCLNPRCKGHYQLYCLSKPHFPHLEIAPGLTYLTSKEQNERTHPIVNVKPANKNSKLIAAIVMFTTGNSTTNSTSDVCKMQKKCMLQIHFACDPDQVSRIPITTGGNGEVAMAEKGQLGPGFEKVG